MEITLNDIVYFVPDEIGTDKAKTVADIYAAAIPLNIYNLQQEIATVNSQIQALEAEPDEILVPNIEKAEALPGLQERLSELNLELAALVS